MSDQTEAIRERGGWHCRVTIAKFDGEWTPGAVPYEVLELERNMLLHGGVSLLWQAALGNGTATANQALTYLNAANAAIAVGDSATAAAATQTNVLGANRLRKGMDSGFPTHTDGTTAAAKTIVFRSTFDTSEANFAWQEAGVCSSVVDGSGRMLNRKVQNMGTKTSASSWQVTFTIDIT